jgi:formylglycine-generating enzyme required for sulfatase activity
MRCFSLPIPRHAAALAATLALGAAACLPQGTGATPTSAADAGVPDTSSSLPDPAEVAFDPSEPEQNQFGGARVRRGGSFADDPLELRAGSRSPGFPQSRYNTDGLRLVRSLP